MAKQIDLKNTLNLPRTDFAMKANLPTTEPRLLQQWDEMKLYDTIRAARKGRRSFILHDGPPYANGHIHLGHALNKILKDLIVKSKTMEGYDSPYLPGWDCHGLPIEIKVIGKKKTGLDPLKVRQQCRQYAQKYVQIQKDEFKRLGVFGEWDNPYLTMSNDYEAQEARLFGKFVEQGSVYRGLKPVHWCISCETALAEAEVEYADHTSPSVYVKFPVESGSASLSPDLLDRKVFVLIWTTTPWTLPSNLAICFHPDFQYSFIAADSEVYIVAKELVEAAMRDCGIQDYRVLFSVEAKALEILSVRHPWLERPSRILLAEHVTLEQGTGAVHTAPGHGQEDYEMGVKHGLDIYCPVDNAGRFASDVLHFAGLNVFEANAVINRFMAERNVLLAERKIRHSYPHCWRCHNPVVFRATPQWFISMEVNGMRSRALDEIRKTRWIPAWGEERISNMVAHRPDWCISRQRFWGVPIVVFYCKACRKPLLSREAIEHVAEIFQQESADAWYARTPGQLLPEGVQCACGGTEFDKEYDILDVWFDSGVSNDVVLGKRADLPWPSDVYLEGGDQYRGWFHSSLLVAVAVHEAAPYRTAICNGWTLDAEGRAMSKSLGNVISPLDIIRADGAEILRLWVASIDYTEDMRLGEEILSRLRDAYRKLRNTNRFLLGNLYDFDPDQAVDPSELKELDRWALARMAYTAKRAEEAYRRYEFHTVYHTLYNFCVVDLSSIYLDILKDRLYISAPGSRDRRAAQTALFTITDTLVRLLAPILPFTAEEIWRNLYADGAPADSVHVVEFSQEIRKFENPDLLQRWRWFEQIREKVSKALEEARRKGEIGSSLEASVRLSAGPEAFQYLESFSEELNRLFIVSEVALTEAADIPKAEINVSISRALGEKCERCWNYARTVGAHEDVPTICSRCYSVLREMGDSD